MLRPNTTIDVTPLPAPKAGLERNGTVDGLRPTMMRGNVKGIVRRVKRNVSVRHHDASGLRQKGERIQSLASGSTRPKKVCSCVGVGLHPALSTVLEFMYGTRAFGSVTEPSAFW
jgi:hypothetical protein